MATIDITPTWGFRLNVCEDNCTTAAPVTISIDFGYQREVLKALWPDDGAGGYEAQNYTLVITDYQDTEVLNTTGTIDPDTLDIDVPEMNTDGIYKITLNIIGATIGSAEVPVTQEVYAVVLCSLRCCYAKLLAKMDAAGKCDRKELLAFARLTMYISQIEQLVKCDNNVVGAKQLLTQAAKICASVNCTC